MIAYPAPDCVRLILETGKLVKLERIAGVVVVSGLPASLYGYQVERLSEEVAALRGGRER